MKKQWFEPESDLLVKYAKVLTPDDRLIMGWANDSIQKEPIKVIYQKPIESKRKQRKRRGAKP